MRARNVALASLGATLISVSATIGASGYVRRGIHYVIESGVKVLGQYIQSLENGDPPTVAGSVVVGAALLVLSNIDNFNRINREKESHQEYLGKKNNRIDGAIYD
jgi:hypothetical protein